MESIARGMPRSLRQFGQWMVSMRRRKLYWYGPRYVANPADMATPPDMDDSRSGKQLMMWWIRLSSLFNTCVLIKQNSYKMTEKHRPYWLPQMTFVSNRHNSFFILAKFALPYNYDVFKVIVSKIKSIKWKCYTNFLVNFYLYFMYADWNKHVVLLHIH